LELEIVIVPGDNCVAAEAAARNLGLQMVESELPEQKSAVIRDLQAKVRKVVIARDGNGASAPAQTEVSIAMGAGIDMAMKAPVSR
jgi:cation transport ATPase